MGRNGFTGGGEGLEQGDGNISAPPQRGTDFTLPEVGGPAAGLATTGPQMGRCHGEALDMGLQKQCLHFWHVLL